MNLAKFKSFEPFFAALLPEERAIVERVRELILGHFPGLKEKFGYGVPYYWGHSRICFLYPASFPYSGIDEGVNFGFTRGYLLSNEQGLLQMGDRREVAMIHLRSADAVREGFFLEILEEAVALDAEMKRMVKR